MTDDGPGADFIDEADRRKALPEHERDDTSVGGGLMSSGVSAGAGAGGDEGGDPTVATQMVAGTSAVSGSQPMAPGLRRGDRRRGRDARPERRPR